MRFLTWLRRGLGATWARRTGNQDIADELAFHMSSRADDLVARGMPPAQATRQARLEFGSRDKAADECREAARFTFVEDFARDCRHSVRSLRKHPGLIFISLASLAFGIGVNTLLFGAVRGVFLSQPSGVDPKRLAWVETAGANQLSYLNYKDLAGTGGFASIAGYRQAPLSVRGEHGAESVSGMVITRNLFRTLGVTPVLGRDVTESSGASDEEAVISHGFWRRRFAQDPAAVGQAMVINGRSFALVGVLPEDYSPLVKLLEPDVYVPVSAAVLPGLDSRDDSNALSLIARLKPDNGAAQAMVAINAFDAERAQQDPSRAERQQLRRARLTPLGSLMLSEAPLAVKLFPTFLGLLCGLVLLIAAANVAGLLLARALSQRHELALLSALGASRRRIMQRIFADSLMLSLAGAVFGLLLALWFMPMLQDLNLPGIGVVHLRMQSDWQLAGFAALLMLGSGVLCGMVPALSATRRDPARLLRHGVVLGITSRLRLRQALVVVETAATVVLLVTAFLFSRTLVRLTLVDTGLDLDRGIVSSIDLRPGEGRTPRTIAQTERLLEEMRAVPGVEAAGVVEIIPLTMDISNARFSREDDSKWSARAMINSVGPGYFRAIGIDQLAGRDFAPSDRAGAPSVVVVNERFASMFFEDGQATGHRIRAGRGEWSEIVGVVSNNSVHNAGEDPPYAQVFYAWAQRPVSTQQRAVSLVVRSSGPPESLLRPVQAIATQLDADAPTRTRTLRDATAFEMSVRIAAVQLLTTLGTLGLLLASIGLYGIVSYLVASQTTELGVRMALGATAPMVLREVLWRGLRLTLWGLGAGMVFSLAGARLLASLLAGLSPADPVSFFGSAALLILMGLLASFLPARRATRTDPMVVLRQS